MDSADRPVIFGEVLFDRFPDGEAVLGGAPFNVAWHLQAFGQAPLFVSRVGNDSLGRRIRTAMQTWGMDTSGLQLDSQHPTGTVEVSFENNEPSYDIVPDRAWDHIAAATLPRTGVRLLYHGTLALRSAASAAALAALKQACETPTLLDVNLRPPWWQAAQVHDLMAGARWVKLNEDELQLLVAGAQQLEDKAMQLLHQHRLELLIVTRGGEGATAFTRTGAAAHIRPESDTDIVDTVGAGDAFTSVIILGLLMDWPLQRTMERAQRFASAVVGVRGATVQERAFYTSFIDEWELQRS